MIGRPADRPTADLPSYRAAPKATGTLGQQSDQGAVIDSMWRRKPRTVISTTRSCPQRRRGCANRLAIRIGICIISTDHVASTEHPSCPHRRMRREALPSRSPCTTASIATGRRHATSSTSTRIRYGSGGAMTPRMTAPGRSFPPSRLNSCSQGHQLSNCSACSYRRPELAWCGVEIEATSVLDHRRGRHCEHATSRRPGVLSQPGQCQLRSRELSRSARNARRGWPRREPRAPRARR